MNNTYADFLTDDEVPAYRASKMLDPTRFGSARLTGL
jgi:hypothetical protein